MGTKRLKNATINHPVKLRIYRVNQYDRISNSDRFLQKKKKKTIWFEKCCPFQL